jgi:hypothetical protein
MADFELHFSDEKFGEIYKEIIEVFPEAKTDANLLSRKFVLKFPNGIIIYYDVMRILYGYNPEIEPASALVKTLDLTTEEAVRLANSLLGYALYNFAKK